ncbi:MAG: class I tRNA ligase family protein, partial [Slackia sp.]|nr:class I tRNA ligase family protein [Slackia sp.]
EKMSKSKGNGIDPREVTDKYGADVLRLWVASTDYSVDVSIGDTILQRTSDAYRRFRNTFRFLLGNLDGFDWQRDRVEFDALKPIDVWALLRLREVLHEVERGYDEYHYHQVFRTLYDYVITDLSAVYMDVIKDRLYAEAPDSPSRRAAQTVLMNILEVMVRIMSPILTFTCDEVWEHYPEAERNREGRVENVQLAGWPTDDDFYPVLPKGDQAEAFMARFDALLEVRDAVTKALEDARNAKTVNKSQEAALTISAPEAAYEALAASDASDLEELFIVASVAIERTEADEVSVAVSKTEAAKCPRCWNHRELGADSAHPDVCARCAAVLEKMGE